MLSDMALLYPNSSGAEGSTSNGAAFANPGDGPGSASPLCNHFAEAPSDALLAYMESCHVGSWQRTLNDNTSTRPEWAGGATVRSVTACKTFTPPGSASASWQCTLDLPNSFNRGDGIRLCVSSKGPTKQKADQFACRLAFTYLLMENPAQMLLRARHWNVSITELLANMPDS